RGSEPTAGLQDGVVVFPGCGFVDREGPVVAAEVLDAAQRDLLVIVVALAGPSIHVAERPAPADGDFLQLRMQVGEGRAVVDGSLGQLFEALGRYRHASQCGLSRPRATRRAGIRRPAPALVHSFVFMTTRTGKAPGPAAVPVRMT